MNMHSRSRHRRERGLHILSFAVGIIISASVAAMLIAWMSKIRMDGKVMQLTRSVAQLHLAIERGFQLKSDYSGLSRAWVIENGEIPPGMDVNSSGLLIHAFGGRVEVFSAAYPTTGGPNAMIVIGLDDLNQEQCVAVSTALMSAHQTDAWGIRFRVPSVYTYSFVDGEYPTPQQVRAHCSESNALHFRVFY